MMCPDCPHLNAAAMPDNWKPAARCCADRHPSDRMHPSGSYMSDPTPGPNRAQRRAGRKGKR